MLQTVYLKPINFADDAFRDNIKEIINYGSSTEGEIVRTRWADTNEPAHTKFITNVCNTYFLDTMFPACSLRRLAFKSCIDEILWIWQRKSNNIKELHSHVWDAWADDNGSIGKAYGWQVKNHLRNGMDQTDYIIHELKNNPFSRRIIGMLYNIDDLAESALDACCYSVTYSVRKDEDGNKILDCLLNQRSNDFIVANNWNLCQYAVLQHMFAQVCGMKVGKITHVIANAHIYDRHIPLAKELIDNPSYHAPTLWVNPDVKNFYDFTVDDFKLIDYKYHELDCKIPVAI